MSTAPTAGGTATAAAPAQSEADMRAEVGRIFSMGVARGQIAEDDEQRLAALLSTRSSIPPEKARKRVDEAITMADAVQQDVKRRAQEVAETARSTTSRAAFWVTVIMMLTGVAAWYEGVLDLRGDLESFIAQARTRLWAREPGVRTLS